MSAMVPPPFVIGAMPKQPARKRNAMSEPILGATAQAMVKATNARLQALYMGTRPYISLKGAITRGPIANPRM